MPTIVFQTNKNGIKYAYESVSYWDKEKKAPRSKRKYIGKVDPKTGEIIPPKSKKNDCMEEPNQQDGGLSANIEVEKLRSELDQKKKELDALKKELTDIRTKYRTAIDALLKIYASASDVLETDGRN